MIKEASYAGMNNTRLDQLIREIAENVDGVFGAWRFEVTDILMYCITDEAHDRMRVIAPIANVDETPEEVLRECLAANFDRALDARYCIHDETIWGAFIHPLSHMTEDFFESAVAQVVQVAKNFGGSYSGGALVFGAQG